MDLKLLAHNAWNKLTLPTATSMGGALLVSPIGGDLFPHISSSDKPLLYTTTALASLTFALVFNQHYKIDMNRLCSGTKASAFAKLPAVAAYSSIISLGGAGLGCCVTEVAAKERDTKTSCVTPEKSTWVQFLESQKANQSQARAA